MCIPLMRRNRPIAHMGTEAFQTPSLGIFRLAIPLELIPVEMHQRHKWLTSCQRAPSSRCPNPACQATRPRCPGGDVLQIKRASFRYLSLKAQCSPEPCDTCRTYGTGLKRALVHVSGRVGVCFHSSSQADADQCKARHRPTMLASHSKEDRDVIA